MTFLPEGFVVPSGLDSAEFRLRPITAHDAVEDHEAVMANRMHLWSLFGAGWRWPPADLTLEQDRIDLAWHEEQARLRRSFNYAIVEPGEGRLLGCFYIDPPAKCGFDAQAYHWVRRDGVPPGLEDDVDASVRAWLKEAWPFPRVAFPGRDIPWPEWDALPPIAEERS